MIIYLTLAGHSIDCFSCSSWSDPRCQDPFNWTVRVEDMPRIVGCQGCCVKMVREVGTVMESVRRTCTDDLDINLFMVDHVCMSEGGGRGHMCFCEEDDCNGARARICGDIPVLLGFTLVLIVKIQSMW